jgi:hypothetical protein
MEVAPAPKSALAVLEGMENLVWWTCDEAQKTAWRAHFTELRRSLGRLENELEASRRECEQAGTKLAECSRELEEARRKLAELRKPAAVPWVIDASRSACAGCKGGFGLFFRRHHCRACGDIFCRACAGVFIPVPRWGYSAPVRVCGSCARSPQPAPQQPLLQQQRQPLLQQQQQQQQQPLLQQQQQQQQQQQAARGAAAAAAAAAAAGKAAAASACPASTALPRPPPARINLLADIKNSKPGALRNVKAATAADEAAAAAKPVGKAPAVTDASVIIELRKQLQKRRTQIEEESPKVAARKSVSSKSRRSSLEKVETIDTLAANDKGDMSSEAA